MGSLNTNQTKKLNNDRTLTVYGRNGRYKYSSSYVIYNRTTDQISIDFESTPRGNAGAHLRGPLLKVFAVIDNIREKLLNEIKLRDPALYMKSKNIDLQSNEGKRIIAEYAKSKMLA